MTYTVFDPIQQEQMVLSYINKHGSIKRAEAMDLCRITKDQAYKLLSRLKDTGKIEQKGERKGAVYMRKRKVKRSAQLYAPVYALDAYMNEPASLKPSG